MWEGAVLCPHPQPSHVAAGHAPYPLQAHPCAALPCVSTPSSCIALRLNPLQLHCPASQPPPVASPCISTLPVALPCISTPSNTLGIATPSSCILFLGMLASNQPKLLCAHPLAMHCSPGAGGGLVAHFFDIKFLCASSLALTGGPLVSWHQISLRKFSCVDW